VPNYLFERLVETAPKFDLAINTLSMSEMDASQVEYYCRGLKQLLSDDGVFFEQNQNNVPIGRLDAQAVIAQHFGHRQQVDSRIVGTLTQGRAHLWSKQACQPCGQPPAAKRTANSRLVAARSKVRSMSTPNSRVERIFSRSQ
jgi:hypothetical protein